ncbi:hypothetical protein E3V93_11520 [Microbacterium sp. 3H14]|uniref:nucleotidyltransferase family protein n=1 Tax=unclassified Microbacterium TaxID=2609290 RepID=UPI001069AE20|nr:nucleotidyltransferase family protein [Microbacterium sp. 3H14]TFB17206.1 hypothetical protein E3V93_11520 [Microbacterium sp. 3H14]
MTEVALRAAEATALAHAMTAHIAREAGIRLLSIKGPVADHYGLRAPRVPADSDVWVEPSRFSEMCERLEARGWHLRVGRETPALLPQHSRTFIHDSWPCDIDLHWMFPGFFADASVAFDAVWETRSSIEVAHTAVAVPSLAGSAVIGMLHALRNTQDARHRQERDLLTTMLIERFSASDRAEFSRIARRGGAVWVLRDVITQAGLGEVVSDASENEKRRWTLFQAYVEDGSAVSWWVQLRGAPLSQRARLLARALWVPRADVPRNDPSVLPTRAEAWRYQRLRWARGGRALLRYFRRERERERVDAAASRP